MSKDRVELVPHLCDECGKSNFSSSKLSKHYTESFGFSVVLYDSVFEHKCDGCGYLIYRMPDRTGLEKAVALARALVPVRLSGDEVKTLRKVAGLKAVDLAEQFGVAPGTFSRWESGNPPMSVPVELLFRAIVAIELQHKAPGVRFKVQDILKMNIPAANSSGEKVVLELQRGFVPIKNNSEDFLESYIKKRVA